MTTYYKGNNMQLTFDGTSWSIGNVAQNFIDPNTFSSPDPVFPTVPETPETDTTTPETDPCPPGYIYDNTLKQCVPDPNAQNPFVQQQGGGGGGPDRQPIKIAGTNRYTTDNNFIASDAEYDAMTPQELVENYKQRGMVSENDDGNLIIDISPSVGDALFDAAIGATVGKFGATSNEAIAGQKKHLKRLIEKGMIHSDLNPEVMNFYPSGVTSTEDYIEKFPLTLLNTGDNAKIVIPTAIEAGKTVTGNTGTFLTPGFGKLTFDDFHGSTIVEQKPTTSSWENYMNNLSKVQTSVTKTVTSPQDVGAPSANIFDNAINEQKLEQEKEKTKQQKIKTDKEIDEATGKFSGDKTDKQIDTDTGKFSGSPKASTKPQAPPGQPTTGTHIGYGGGGTSLGSSVHGTGSYNKPTSKPKRQTGPQMGDR